MEYDGIPTALTVLRQFSLHHVSVADFYAARLTKVFHLGQLDTQERSHLVL
jgi:hypothetical protein